MSIQELFSNKEYCYDQLREARKIFTDINSTEKQYEAMETTLAFMYLYCSEDLQSIVFATLNEAQMRKYRFIYIWKKNNG